MRHAIDVPVDVHHRALLAAAHLALVATTVAACEHRRAAVATAPEPEVAAPPTAVAEVPPADEPCGTLLAREFPVPGEYMAPGKPLTARGEQCCDQMLRTMRPVEHRWDCCSSLGPTADPNLIHGSACTPWGPAVPPTMPRESLA